MLGPDQLRVLKGMMYWVGARIAQKSRSPSDWSESFLFDIHRDLFGSLFAEHAARLRQVEVSFRGHNIPVPAQIPYRLRDLVEEAREIVQQARGTPDAEDRIQAILPRIARFHANCVVVQPFIDGNKRWARQALSALLVDCEFWPGSRIEANERDRYLEGIDKSIAGDHDQLAELILEGWLRLEEDFSSGTY